MQREWQEQNRGKQVRDLQIIVVSMTLGVLMLVGVASVFGPVGVDKPWGWDIGPVLPYLAVGCGVIAMSGQATVAVALSRSVRGNIALVVVEDARTAGGLARVPEAVLASRLRGLLSLFRVMTILRSALLEGAALFCGVAYLLEGSYLALGGAVTLALALAARIPTGSGVDSWLTEQTRLIQDQCIA